MTSTGQLEPDKPPAGTADDPYFALIVGTGFGGAVVACRLAQARAAERPAGGTAPRRSVLVMERGRRYAREDFGRLKLPDYLARGEPETSKRLPETARLFWENDQGLWDLRNLGELRLAQAAGYGGGSLIYANVHLRPPQQVFDDPKWKAKCDGGACACADLQPAPYSRDGLRTYYDRAAAMLDLARVPAKNRPPKTQAMEQLATIAGPGPGHFLFPPLAITFDAPPGGKDGMNRFNRPQSPCTNCGNCTVGCQEGAKNTLDLNYLAVAEDLGAEVRTLSEVQTIRPFPHGGRQLLRVTYIDHTSGHDKQVVAEHVFLCAGAAGSTAILMRSHDPAKHEEPPPNVARGTTDLPTVPMPIPDRVGAGFFANGDNIGVAFGAKLPDVGALSPTVGPTITAAIVHGGPSWFLLEDGGIPPSVKQGLGLLRSPLWGARNRFAAPGKGQVGILDHALETLHEAHRYWLSEVAPSPTGPVARALRQMVPESLTGIVDDLAGAAAFARKEISTIVDGTLEGVDAQLRKKFLIGWLLKKVRPVVIPNAKVYGPANRATAARHPLTADLLSEPRPMDYVLSALRFLLFGAPVNDDTMMFLCMGPDHAGRLHWREQRLRIEWNLEPENLALYDTQERLMRDAATMLKGELRSNPDWTLGRKPVTVHAQGGCGMAGNGQEGVTTPCGRLWTCDQLYVMDGAVFPGSVGVNPSATIAAVAERNIELFIRRQMPTAGDYWTIFPGRDPDDRITLTPREDFDDSLQRTLPIADAAVPRAQQVVLSWHEELGGRLMDDAGTGGTGALDLLARGPLPKGTPLDRGHFRSLERRGRLEGTQVVLKLDVQSGNLEYLMMDDAPTLNITGTLLVGTLPQQQPVAVEGTLRLDLADVPGGKRSSRTWMRPRRLTGMTYKLKGNGVTVSGHKTIQDDPGIDVWKDLSTLYTSVVVSGSETRKLGGVLRVHLPDFVNRQLRGMDVAKGLPDDFVRAWGFIRFARFFFGSITNAYSDWS